MLEHYAQDPYLPLQATFCTNELYGRTSTPGREDRREFGMTNVIRGLSGTGSMPPRVGSVSSPGIDSSTSPYFCRTNHSAIRYDNVRGGSSAMRAMACPLVTSAGFALSRYRLYRVVAGSPPSPLQSVRAVCLEHRRATRQSQAASTHRTTRGAFTLQVRITWKAWGWRPSHRACGDNRIS